MILCIYLVHSVSFLKRFFFLIVINYFILTDFFCGFVINRMLPLKNTCTHLQVDNRVLVMPRGPLDMLKKILGMHAQVVTKPSLAPSGQLTIQRGQSIIISCCQAANNCMSTLIGISM